MSKFRSSVSSAIFYRLATRFWRIELFFVIEVIFIVFAVVCGAMLLNLWISISVVRGTERVSDNCLSVHCVQLLISDISAIFLYFSKNIAILKWVQCHEQSSLQELIVLPFVQPYLALQGGFIVLFILESIFSRQVGPIVASVIGIYFWVCIYSLYEKIKIEHRISAARLDLELSKWCFHLSC